MKSLSVFFVVMGLAATLGGCSRTDDAATGQMAGADKAAKKNGGPAAQGMSAMPNAGPPLVTGSMLGPLPKPGVHQPFKQTFVAPKHQQPKSQPAPTKKDAPAVPK